jgi:hypothetical protein
MITKQLKVIAQFKHANRVAYRNTNPSPSTWDISIPCKLTSLWKGRLEHEIAKAVVRTNRDIDYIPVCKAQFWAASRIFRSTTSPTCLYQYVTGNVQSVICGLCIGVSQLSIIIQTSQGSPALFNVRITIAGVFQSYMLFERLKYQSS